MGKFINPFTDVGFKRIFGQEITKDLLIDFLNDLLRGERNILDITFLDKEQIPVFDKDRGLIYDIYCTTDTGRRLSWRCRTSIRRISRTARCTTFLRL